MGFEAEERAANARWERFLGQPIEPESDDTDEIEDIERCPCGCVPALKEASTQ